MFNKSFKTLIKNVSIVITLTLISACKQHVYICEGPDSYAYHYDNKCPGLERCTTELRKVSKEEAKNLGRKECGWED